MTIPLLRAAALAAALIPWPAHAATLSIAAALDLAVQRSEAARAGRAGLQGAAEAARAAGQLPDPTLSAGVDNLPVTGSDRLHTARDSMTMKRLGLSQEWVSRDKRAARGRAAQAAVDRQAVAVDAAVAETRLQTALAYVDAYYAARALELTTQAEHHAHEELETARARLASAAANSQEVLALAGALATAEDESAEVRQQQNAARVQLERWSGTRAAELLEPPSAALPDEPGYVAAHPVVAGLRRDAELACSEAAATAANADPNWTWGVSYGQRTGYSDMLSFGVSIPIPLRKAERQDRDTAARLALASKAEADLGEATRAATAEYRGLAGDAQRLQERIDRWRGGVAAPASQRSAVALASYGSNLATLMTLFEARHAELASQRRLLGLQRDLARVRAQLLYRPMLSGAAP